MSETRNEILEQLTHLHMLLHRHQMQSLRNFGPFSNPHRGQGRILAILKIKPEISQKDLTYLLDMSKQAIAELLNKLEKNGYIQREISNEDHRSFNVKLTEKGVAATDKIEDDKSCELEKVFDCLNDDELSNLHEYLNRIIENLKSQFGEDTADFHRQMFSHFMKHGHFHHFRRGADCQIQDRFHNGFGDWYNK
jgi:DNA-binding MarR family transcriptional regulator